MIMIAARALLVAALLCGPAWAGQPPAPMPDGTTIGKSTSGQIGTLMAAAPYNRPPNANDDSTRGYKAGDLWLYASQLWSAYQVNPGQAAWTPLYIGSTLPLDLAVAPTMGAWGTVRLSANYSGNDLILTRGYDSTTATIGFVGNVVDAKTADAFCSAHGDLAAGTCYVTTVYAQDGSGCTATQATVGNAPIWTTNLVNGLRAITFNSVETGPTGGLVSKWLSTFCSYIPNRTSIVALAKPRSSVQNNSFFTVGANAVSFITASESYPTGVAISGASTNALVGLSSPAISLFSVWANTGTVYQNNFTTTFSTGVNATSTAGATLGVNVANGSSVGYGPADNDLVALEVVAATSQLTSANLTALRASFSLLGNVAPQTSDVWIADGDSITNGFQATALQGYPSRAIALMQRPVNLYNLGWSGIALGSKITAFNTTYTSGLIAACNAARNCVISVDLGTNDITDATVAATLYAQYQSYFAMIKAVCPNAKLLAVTLTPRTDDATEDATIVAYNSFIQAGWASFASDLIDFASDPTMGAALAWENTALYADSLHPTDLGYSILGPIAAKQVLAQMSVTN